MGGCLSQAVKGFDNSEVDDFIENVRINAMWAFFCSWIENVY